MPNDTHSDRARLTLAAIERDYELGGRAHPAVPRFIGFRDAIAALGQLDRLQYQDDSSEDPSDAFFANSEHRTRRDGHRPCGG